MKYEPLLEYHPFPNWFGLPKTEKKKPRQPNNCGRCRKFRQHLSIPRVGSITFSPFIKIITTRSPLCETHIFRRNEWPFLSPRVIIVCSTYCRTRTTINCVNCVFLRDGGFVISRVRRKFSLSVMKARYSRAPRSTNLIKLNFRSLGHRRAHFRREKNNQGGDCTMSQIINWTFVAFGPITRIGAPMR